MIETPEKDVFQHPVTRVADMSLSEYLAARIRNYEKRTKRADGLDIIRDTLAIYGVKRFSHMPPTEQLECLAAITDIFDKAT